MEKVPEKPKKKRRRKPKKEKKNEVQQNYNISDNLVIRLKHIDEDYKVIEPYSQEDIYEENENENDKVGELCWNCCHPFNTIIYGLPLKYIGKVFYTYGDFCSLECCSRYALEHFEDHYEIISLINLYNNVMNVSTDKIICMAPHRLLLKAFGGKMDIEEYRSKSNDRNIHDLKIPPILPIKHTIDSHEINHMNNKSNLKLYRKKPLLSDKKSITASMKLTIN